MVVKQSGELISSGVAATQLGDYNVIDLTQSGSNNQAMLVQIGLNNEMKATQSGGDNRLIWTQIGSDLSNVAVNQTGGQALQITQSR